MCTPSESLRTRIDIGLLEENGSERIAIAGERTSLRWLSLKCCPNRGLALRIGLFENADYLFPGTSVVKLVLAGVNVRCSPLGITRIETRLPFDHGFHCAPEE